MKGYRWAHDALTARVGAYRELFDELARRLRAQEWGSRSPRIALLPSSTGRLLESTSGLPARWTAIDRSSACLEDCKRRGHAVEKRQVSLPTAWTRPGDRFEGVVTVHSAHFVPGFDRVAAEVRDVLVPGGHWWIVAHDCERRVRDSFRAARESRGLPGAIDVLPWILADRWMVRSRPGAAPCTADEVRRAVGLTGLELVEDTAVFAGLSRLQVWRRR